MVRSIVVALGLMALAVGGMAQDAKPKEYQFKKAPLAIYDALADLSAGDVPPMSADERKLLETVWQWRTAKKSAAESRSDQAMVLEAMLFASGIEEQAARDKYRAQFEKVVAAANSAAKDAKNDPERGERLMKVLHGGVMKTGYSLNQTSLAAVFDTGRYNCVSSTAMYLLTGERLGLKLVPISIPGKPFVPGHAALDLLDGTARVQIEPTNPDGFDWLNKSKRPGVTIIGFLPDRKLGHETDALGIAASIYTNRGVALNKEKPPQHAAAIRCDLAALALDPTDGTATNNLISDFVNWGPVLAKGEKAGEAVRLLTFGKSISPPSRELDGNLAAAYQTLIDERLAARQDQEALAAIEEAGKTLPADRDFQSPARWFARRANLDQKDAGWEAGLAVIRRGLAIVPAKEKKELAKARTSLYRQWSQALLEKRDVDGSAKVLREALAAGEPDDSLRSGLGYHTVTALAQLDKAGGDKLVEHFELLRREFPGIKQVIDAGLGFAMNAVQDLAEADKFPEAAAAAKRYQPLATGAERQAELGAYPYDLWARNLAEKKEWQAAYDKYAEGLKAFPQQPRLVQNLAATIFEWAEPEVEAQRWDEAIRIYDLGLVLLPDHAALKLRRADCVKKRGGN